MTSKQINFPVVALPHFVGEGSESGIPSKGVGSRQEANGA